MNAAHKLHAIPRPPAWRRHWRGVLVTGVVAVAGFGSGWLASPKSITVVHREAPKYETEMERCARVCGGRLLSWVGDTSTCTCASAPPATKP